MLEKDSSGNGLLPEDMGTLIRKDRSRDDVLKMFLQLTTSLFNMPSGYISIVDDTTHNVIVSHQISMTPKPRQFSFCQYVVDSSQPVIVPNTCLDQRFCEHPLVVGSAGIRFYAGMPLTFRNGVTIGSYCVIDTIPRDLTEDDLTSLNFISDLVTRFIESWLDVAQTDLNSGLPNMHQLIGDLQSEVSNDDNNYSSLILIECIGVNQSEDIARTMGIKNLNRLIKDISFTLEQTLQLKPSEKLYMICAGRFALYSKNLTSNERSLRERQLRNLQAHLADGVTIGLNICVGETAITLPISSGQEILRQAESALYAARCSHAHRWSVYNQDDDDKRNNDFYLLYDLTDAIRKGVDLFLVWQPKVTLPDGNVSGLEALIRWNHPARGILSPGIFLPLIADTSLMVELTDWVIDHAIEQQIQWTAQGLRLPTSINISILDLTRGNFTQNLVEKIEKAGLDRALLGIECLETEKLLASSNVIEELRLLRQEGFSVSIDDFGTGYSNLNYLSKIPADIVKLDKSLIDNVQWEPSQQIIVRHVIRILKDLGYTVIAEGIEDEKTADILSEFGCDQAQGYFFARPMTTDKLELWLNNIHFLENKAKAS